jgi:2-oxoglutarate ferredoxin oxidoreductase subunit alpha
LKNIFASLYHYFQRFPIVQCALVDILLIRSYIIKNNGGCLDFSIKIGGEAGQGIQTVGDLLTKVFSRSGFYVFTHQDYESRVRGGHNFYQIRLSDKPISASRKKIDIVIAFDEATIMLHESELTDGGTLVYDPAITKKSLEAPHFLKVPFTELAAKSGGSAVTANTVATGVIIGMLGHPIKSLLDTLPETLKNKDEKNISINREAAKSGYEYAGVHCTRCAFTLSPSSEPLMVIDGNEAIGLGAAASGCKFYSAYPMTPSTGIMVSLAKKARDFGIVVEQAEDEIAAINMALGASFAGVRAMTGSSGGGFALMVEGLSLAAMTETPIVVALAQRPGPATGFPTRTEQGELLFALHAGHGEFPRIIFAPGSPEEAFYLTNKAFDLSQRFQVPVFILTDQYLADTQWTYEKFNTEGLIYVDYRLREKIQESQEEYKRHAFTDNGISPFAIPGESKHLVVTDSDEHNEEGHLIEDGPTRVKMVNKRYFLKKGAITASINPPHLYGSKEPETVIVGWGSTYGIMKETVDALSGKRSIAMLHFSEIYPFPGTEKFDYIDVLRKAKKTIIIEQNATSQFARLMKTETGYSFADHINRYDGRPFMIEELTGEIDGLIG